MPDHASSPDPHRFERAASEPAPVPQAAELTVSEPDEQGTTVLLDDEEEAPAASASPAVRADRAPRHAGFIVQREGRIERVVPWEGDTLVVGRAADCDLVLAQEEVSRRHARFTRSGDCYEIHDLGSVNGTLVNGKRTERHVLAVGDVITIESFQLTFVLDHEPISSVMKPSVMKPSGMKPSAVQPGAMQPSGMEPAAARPEHGEPFASSGAEQAGPASAAASLPPDATIANITLEEDLFAPPSGLDLAFEAEAEPADEHKELAAVQPRGSARAATVQQLGTPSAESAVVTLELRVRADQLPEPLRRALAETGELVIPADLRLRA